MRRLGRKEQEYSNTSGRESALRGHASATPTGIASAESPATDGQEASHADEGLFDEPIGGLRHIRLWSGLFLIVVALILIVVEQLLGLDGRSTVRVRPPAAQPVPGLFTPFEQPDLRAEARFVERSPAVNGVRAGAGRVFVVMEVLITNRRLPALEVNYSNFHVAADSQTVCTAEPYPGKATALQAIVLAKGTSREGPLICAVPADDSDLVFEYSPDDGSGSTAHWSVSPGA